VAAPAGARVGVDLERRDAVNPAHAGYFLTPRERVGRTLTLAELWALKEAAWKALALDGAVAFHELELHVDGAGRLRALTLRGRRMAASATLGTPWPGYVLATVVVEGRAC
jgi:phosphopantetheinyl transferase (holo-ACP synthase)